MKLTKRIATTGLATAMALSLAAPALAATNTSTKVTAKYEAIVLDVIVPATGTAKINPYKLPFDLTLTDTNADPVSIKNQQIVTLPLSIVNKSKVDLDVNAEITSTVTGSFTFATDAVESDATTNTGYVFLEAKATTLTNDDMKSDGTGVDADKLTTQFAEWEASTELPEGAIVLTGTGVAKKEDTDSPALVTLKAATVNDSDKSKTDVAAGGIAMFRLGGSVAQAPTKAWTTTDGFTATIAFTFTPNVSDSTNG